MVVPKKIIFMQASTRIQKGDYYLWRLQGLNYL